MCLCMCQIFDFVFKLVFCSFQFKVKIVRIRHARYVKTVHDNYLARFSRNTICYVKNGLQQSHSAFLT
jgi:hypothetical protein